MGALIPLLVPLIPGLVQFVEAAFSGKAKSGPDKMQTVIRMLGQAAEGMLTAQAPLPDGSHLQPGTVNDDVLRGLVQTELARLKATDSLNAKAPSGNLFLLRGTVTAIPA